MSFRLIRGESIETGLRRIVAEEIDGAIVNLRNEDESLRDQDIHEARKSVKKLRSVVCLLMPGLGTTGIRDNLSLRETGRALSQLRDAAALIETVEALSERHFTDPAMEQLAVVRSALRRRLEDTVRAEDCRTVMGGAVASLKHLKKKAAKWPLTGDEFAAIAPGLEGTYRRGRKCFRKAQADLTSDNLHALRKRIKDYWYHVRLLPGLFAAIAARAREKELRGLQEALGDDHNLTVLRDVLNRDPGMFGGKKMMPAVLELIDREQAGLREQSMASAARVYAVKTPLHVQEISAAWALWQSDARAAKPAVRRTARPATR